MTLCPFFLCWASEGIANSVTKTGTITKTAIAVSACVLSLCHHDDAPKFPGGSASSSCNQRSMWLHRAPVSVEVCLTCTCTRSRCFRSPYRCSMPKSMHRGVLPSIPATQSCILLTSSGNWTPWRKLTATCKHSTQNRLLACIFI